MSEKYNVIFKGEVLNESDLGFVQHSFAKLFKLNIEKAEKYFTGEPRILRKNVDHKVAYQFKVKLEKIGAVVELQRLPPESSLELDGLSLVPIEGENKPQKIEEIPTEKLKQTKIVNQQFSCPKCGTEQVENIECVSCGIIFKKYIAKHNASQALRTSHKLTEDSTRDNLSQTNDEQEVEINNENIFSLNSVIASIVAALLGAFIWQFIAVKFDYELSLVAWLIGGAIGFSAAMFGSRGEVAGLVCGLLALLSIFVGKYMAYDTFQSEWKGMMLSPNAEFRQLYEEELSIARLYSAEVTDNKSKRQFMINYGYSNSIGKDVVTQDEVDYFEQDIEPRLIKLTTENSSYEEWLNQSLLTEAMGAQNISTIGLIRDSLGIIDLLFLFLGVGTAFRLARNE